MPSLFLFQLSSKLLSVAFTLANHSTELLSFTEAYYSKSQILPQAEHQMEVFVKVVALDIDQADTEVVVTNGVESSEGVHSNANSHSRGR